MNIGRSQNLKALVAQAGDVLGAWGATQETSRELVAVRLGTDGALLEHRLWDGAALRAEDVAAGWRLEQGWSPATRAAPLTTREEAPYLVEIVNGRAIIHDVGIHNADGSWSLASDPAVTYASKAAIMALATAQGRTWREEAFAFNPNANLPVDTIGVRYADGIAVDYTVQVTDADGSFFIWARNLDRALELEAKTGDYREFNLRNYEIDFATLDEVGSTDDAVYRVELLTPAQFQFALQLGGLDFNPHMLSAVADAATGHITYSVNDSGRASLSETSYVSPIQPMIEMLDVAMAQYIITSRRFAVRMAMQGRRAHDAGGIMSAGVRPANDDDAWPERPFHFDGRMVA